jgi:hypothetical protein
MVPVSKEPMAATMVVASPPEVSSYRLYPSPVWNDMKGWNGDATRMACTFMVDDRLSIAVRGPPLSAIYSPSLTPPSYRYITIDNFISMKECQHFSKIAQSSKSDSITLPNGSDVYTTVKKRVATVIGASATSSLVLSDGIISRSSDANGSIVTLTFTFTSTNATRSTPSTSNGIHGSNDKKITITISVSHSPSRTSITHLRPSPKQLTITAPL